MAAELVQAGAQLLVGTGPHAAQPIELMNGVSVLFGLVATVEVLDARMVSIELRLLLVDNKVVHFQPRPARDEPALALLRGLLDPALRWQPLPDGYRCELANAG